MENRPYQYQDHSSPPEEPGKLTLGDILKLIVYVPIGLVFGLGGLAYILTTLGAVYAGFDHYLHWVFAYLLATVCFVGRLNLALIIACFFGAWKAWGWHWYWALALAAPGLALWVPSIVIGLVRAAWEWFRAKLR